MERVSTPRRYVLGAALRLALVVAAVCSFAPLAGAIQLPDGFRAERLLTGLEQPTNVQFAADGRIFVAEKSGVLKIYNGLDDADGPDVIDALRDEVHDFWDRGLLGMALHPDFPAMPYVFLLYTHDDKVPLQRGGGASRWGDTCPDPPGAMDMGCVANGRLIRLEIDNANRMAGVRKVLLEGYWCIQYPSHTIGALVFDAGGALVVSAGDGAAFHVVDHGQMENFCGDPLREPGGDDDEGGALRSQDLLTPDDPLSYDGAILRIDPDTGEAMPDNPLVGGADKEDDRIIAHGLRNPFRFAIRPGTNQLWLGDVGENEWEEINVVRDVADARMENFGWPCYEGAYGDGGGTSQVHAGFQSFRLCQRLAQGEGPAQVTPPFFAYHHDRPVVADDSCRKGGSSVSGMDFYADGNYPSDYRGALFFADASRQCIWVMQQRDGPDPDPRTLAVFARDAGAVVDLKRAPNGDLVYVDLAGGVVGRISYFSSNRPPQANLTADRISGKAPLQVRFDGSASEDPDSPDTLRFAWDLDGDGQFDEGSGPVLEHTFELSGDYSVAVQVSDGEFQDVARLSVAVGNTSPQITLLEPADGLRWRAGETIDVIAQAVDEEDGPLAADVEWTVTLYHCVSLDACHTHVVEQPQARVDGTVSRASFVAPDHGYPAYVEVRASVKDSGGLVASVIRELRPRVATVRFDSVPQGIELSVGSTPQVTPFERQFIAAGVFTVGVPNRVELDGQALEFAGWSDGGELSHEVRVDDGMTAMTARFVAPAVAGNLPPEAVFEMSSSAGEAPLSVTFNAGASSDPDGRIVSYHWSFGTQDSAEGVTVSRLFEQPGTYAVLLTVTDDGGASVEVAGRLEVTARPKPAAEPTDSPPVAGNGGQGGGDDIRGGDGEGGGGAWAQGGLLILSGWLLSLRAVGRWTGLREVRGRSTRPGSAGPDPRVRNCPGSIPSGGAGASSFRRRSECSTGRHACR